VMPITKRGVAEDAEDAESKYLIHNAKKVA
jgi:hypothetical protein